jgi:outer membrane biosynthesis protein TonB
MSLHERFLLTIECPECGKLHNFSVDGVVEKGTIYCGCGKTIIINNANRYGKIDYELERPSHQVALSTKAEKKVEIEEEKPTATKPKVEKPKAKKSTATKPTAKKPTATKPKKKTTTTKKPKKEETKK